MWPFGKKTKQLKAKIEEEKAKQDIVAQLVLDPVTKQLKIKPKEHELGIKDPKPLGAGHHELISDESYSSKDVKPSAEDIYDAFLSNFTYPQEISKEDDWMASWSKTLGKPYKEVIGDFINCGLLKRAGLKEKLSTKIYVEELKRALKERGLKVSGKKDELIDRYIEALPHEAQEKVSMVGDMYVCTPEGLLKAKQYEHKTEELRRSAEQEIKRLLIEGRIEEAIGSLARFRQKLPRSQDWNTPRKDELKIIMEIKSAPGLTEAEVEEGRVNVAAQLLWKGEIAGSDPLTKYAVDIVRRYRSIEELKHYAEQEFVTRVEILCMDDACRKCKAMANKKYPLDRVPLIPIEGCSHENGCRCTYAPLVG